MGEKMADDNVQKEIPEVHESGVKAIIIQEVSAIIKSSVWPIITLIIFFQVSEPLMTVLNSFPHLISKTSKLTISGLAIEVDQKLSGAASPELKAALKNISPNGIKMLVDTGTYHIFLNKSYLNFNEQFNTLIELERLGLAEHENNVKSGQEIYDYQYSLTDLGKRAYSLIKEVLINQLVEG